MTNINITNLRKKLYEYINQAVEYGDVINVNTKNGNAVILSEEEYNGMIETLYLSSIPGMVDSLQEARNEPIDECSEYVEGEEW